MPEQDMRAFWDSRAREDAMFFVDSRLTYGDPDDARFWESGGEDLKRILDALEVEISVTDEIVEIGCGLGRITRELAARGAGVRAIDVSPVMLDRARALNPQLSEVEWVLGDGRSLVPIPDASADVCHSHVVFQHLPDPSITLGYVAEIGRVLRPGGWAAITISNAPGVHRPLPVRVRLATAVRGLLGRGPKGQAHPAWRGSAVNLDEVRAVAVESRLEVERVVGEGTQYCLLLLRRSLN